MQTLKISNKVPVYDLERDGLNGNGQFKVYHFEGGFPTHADLLIPHRKNHYLIIFLRKASGRQWIDMRPVEPKENTIYFTGPHQIILKEEYRQLWSTGIAFTSEFLSGLEHTSLDKLPIIRNPYHGHALALTEADILFVEDLLTKIRVEYQERSEWQQRMLAAYVTLLLTYLSRLYTEQYKGNDTSADKLVLQQFQAKIDTSFQQFHEVADYAAMLHISAGHLSEVVKEQSGKPAIKHIHDRLVLESRRLLFHTNNSLKDITFDLGFSDPSYFNRFFKRETGVTPAQYRAAIRKMYH